MPRRNRTIRPIRSTEKPCSGKRRYRSRTDAQAVIDHKRQLDPDTPELDIYRCPHCGGWHLTSARR